MVIILDKQIIYLFVAFSVGEACGSSRNPWQQQTGEAG
jgi:hypothetical protein